MTIHEVGYDLFKRFNIDTSIETGIYNSGTLNVIVGWFTLLEPGWNLHDSIHYDVSKCSHQIYEVDINQRSVDVAKHKHGAGPNVHIECMDSAKYIKSHVDTGEWAGRKCFFYLDAHSANSYWPLRDEITNILKLDKPIIMIDDYKPCAGLCARGYDGYKEGECGTQYLKDLIKGRCCGVFHTIVPNINDRGIGIMFIDRSEDELKTLLDGLPLLLEKI